MSLRSASPLTRPSSDRNRHNPAVANSAVETEVRTSSHSLAPNRRDTTTHLPILIYQASFGSYQIGYAAAISMILGVLMFGCIIFYVARSGLTED